MGVNTVCRSRNSLRSALVQVKQPPEDRKKKSVVCHVYIPCKDYECVYIGETSRTLEKCLREHKNVVKNMTPTMGWQPMLEPTKTKWTGRLPRQEKWKGTIGREGYWKPCTFVNSSTPPTWTVVWQSILPGCCCLTNPLTPDTFLQAYSSPDHLNFIFILFSF